jgi:two-component system response regulator YesN
MYRLLLIDTEQYSLNTLNFYLTHNLGTHNIDILTASNTKEALDFISYYRIDIVITDIFIPNSDGFKLHEEITKRWIHCLFIFFTKSNNFTYVQKTFRLNNVIDFITKTENINTIKDSTEKAISILNKSNVAIIKTETLNNSLPHYNQYTQQIYLKDLIMGKIKDNSNLQNDFDELNILMDTKAPVYTVVGHLNDIPDGFTLKDIEFIFYSLFNIANEYFEEKINSYITNCFEMYFAILLQPSEKLQNSNQSELINDILLQIQITYENIIGKTILFTIPDEPSDFSEIQCYYSKVINQLLFDKNRIKGYLPFNTKDEYELEESALSVSFLKNNLIPLEVALETNNYENFSNILERLNKSHLTSYYQSSIEIFSVVSAMLIKYFINYNKDVILENNLHSILNKRYTTWADSMERLLISAKLICDSVNKMQEKLDWKLLKKINEFIETHISEDLSLKTVAQAMYHSPSYFSKLFKQNAGIGFCSYVEQKRMEKARFLLKNTDARISDIALAISYETLAYFVKVFKNRYGITPMEYRKIKLY